jgi:hypothetical protein
MNQESAGDGGRGEEMCGSSNELCTAPSSLWCVRSRELSWSLGSDSSMPWGGMGRGRM